MCVYIELGLCLFCLTSKVYVHFGGDIITTNYELKYIILKLVVSVIRPSILFIHTIRYKCVNSHERSNHGKFSSCLGKCFQFCKFILRGGIVILNGILFLQQMDGEL